MNDPVAINNTAFQDGQTDGSGRIQEDLRSLNVEALKIRADHLECLFFEFFSDNHKLAEYLVY